MLPHPDPRLQDLILECQSIANLESVVSVLHWDQETYMPPGAIQARSKQIALLSQIAHDRFSGDDFKRLLSAEIDMSGRVKNPIDAHHDRMLYVLWRQWKRTVSVPSEFIVQWAELTSQAQHQWQFAREANDFQRFSPYLRKIVEMLKKRAAYIDPEQPVYTVLLQEYEPDITVSQLASIFSRLKSAIQELLVRIPPTAETQFLGPFEIDAQKRYASHLLQTLKYDTNCGRLDESVHPFTTQFHPTDVRITARYNKNSLFDGLSSVFHEVGHGLYEQGLSPHWFGTPLGSACSLSIHESQSRFWENMIGKNRVFWAKHYSELVNFFPALSQVSVADFYQKMNRVSPGLIRVDADEVTYNLHIIIRMELEMQLMQGDLDVDELPAAWNAAYQSLLGIEPSSDQMGVLQDVHWSMGAFGYFPTYTLGNIISAQLASTLTQSFIDDRISTDKLSDILTWMRDNVHQWGQAYSTPDLVHRICGTTISPEPLIQYYTDKYAKGGV